MVAFAALRAVVTGRILAWAAGTLLVVGASSHGAGEAHAPPAASPSIASRQDTGTLQGAVSAPWAVDDANSVVAVFVDGADHGPLKSDPLIDQFDLTFVPHVLPVTVGTRVRFRNSDTVLHNVFSPSDAVTAFDLGTYSAGGERSIDFEVPGEVVVLCNVHPQMSAFVLVLETAFWGVTDEAGGYSLGGIPAGTHRVTVWNQVAEPLEAEVTIVPGAETRADFAFSERRRGGWIKRRLEAPVTSSASGGMPEKHPANERTGGHDR